MPRCITAARFTMVCDIIKPPGAPESSPSGTWEWRQDPDSGAIVRVWLDDPATQSVNEARAPLVVPDVPLMARGVLTSGTQQVGSTERFSDVYENVDWVKAVFGKNTNITKRDQVTNIRTKKNNELIWKEEEMTASPPTVFNVMGVIPVMDPFSRLLEHSVLLQRAEVQGGA